MHRKMLACGRCSHRVLLLSALAGCILLPALSMADQAPADQLEEISVTATRRSENVQNIPITVTALGAAELAQSGMRNATDIAMLTPGLVMDHNSAQLNPWLRGVGAGDTTVGQDSPIAVYIDGVYQSALYFINDDFNGVDHVEVLKGPQGTLFGRNSTGGAIQIVTKDPSHSTSVMGSLGYGDYHTTDGSLYATTGVTEQLATDLAVTYHDQADGMGRITVDGKTRDWLKDSNFSVRNKWLYTPDDRTKITLSADFAHISGTPDGRAPYPGTHLIDGTANTGNHWNLGSYSVYPETTGRTWGLSARISHSFDPFEFVSISAYRRAEAQQTIDNDLTAAQIVDVYNSALYRTFTQELQLLSKPGSRLKWIVGAFFLSDRSGFGDPSPNLRGDATGITILGNSVGGAVAINNIDTTKSYAFYGEATLPLGESTNLTAGARWTRDERTIRGFTNVLDPNTFAPLVTAQTAPGTVTFTKPTWRIMLDHHFTPDLMGYASVSTGFKSGDYNLLNGDSFGPETLTAYEVGAKSDLWDKRVRLDAAAYYYRYKGIQLVTFEGATDITTNAASAEMAGAELSGDFLVTNHFTTKFTAAYQYSKFLNYNNAVCYQPNPYPPGGDATINGCDLTGARLPHTPQFTFSVAPTYTLPTTIGAFAATATYYHTSSYQWVAGATAEQSAYGLLNTRLSWTANDEHVGFALWAKNLTNTEYASFGEGYTYGNVYTAAPRRSFGATINFKF